MSNVKYGLALVGVAALSLVVYAAAMGLFYVVHRIVWPWLVGALS